MSKELTIKSDLEQQMAVYINNAIEFRSNLEDLGPDQYEEVQKSAIKLEALEKAAQKTRMTELQKEIAITKLAIAKWTGSWLVKKELKPREINLERIESSRYQKIAKMPSMVYDFALESAHNPSVYSALLQYDRYREIGTLAKKYKITKSEVDRMFREGYTPFQAETEMKSTTGLDYSDFITEDDDIEIDWTASLNSLDSSISNLEGLSISFKEAVVSSADVSLDSDSIKIAKSLMKRLSQSKATLTDAFKELVNRGK
jgi:hypothetical protein